MDGAGPGTGYVHEGRFHNGAQGIMHVPATELHLLEDCLSIAPEDLNFEILDDLVPLFSMPMCNPDGQGPVLNIEGYQAREQVGTSASLDAFQISKDIKYIPKGRAEVQRSEDRSSVNQKAARRQQRYRERKRLKEMTKAADIEVQRRKLEELLAINKKLKTKSRMLRSALEYTNDIAVALGGVGHHVDVDSLIESDIIQEQFTKKNYERSNRTYTGNIYAEVLSAFQRHHVKRNNPLLPQSQPSVLSHTLKILPEESAYNLFSAQVHDILLTHDASRDKPDEQIQLERDLKVLFDMRSAAVNALAQKCPETTFSDIIQDLSSSETTINWERSHSGSMTPSKMLACLNLSCQQSSQISHLYGSFLAEWTSASESIMGKGSILLHGLVRTCSAPMGSASLHQCFKRQFCLQGTRYDLTDASNRQMQLLLDLDRDLYSVLTPLQTARLCVASPSWPRLIVLGELLSKQGSSTACVKAESMNTDTMHA